MDDAGQSTVVHCQTAYLCGTLLGSNWCVWGRSIQVGLSHVKTGIARVNWSYYGAWVRINLPHLFLLHISTLKYINNLQ